LKVRLDFITNSSSSSFIVIYEVDKSDKLKEYLKEEFGKYGLRLADTYITLGKDIKTNGFEIGEYFEDDQIDDNKYYMSAKGDSEGDDAWLVKHIPSEFIKEIYNGGE